MINHEKDRQQQKIQAIITSKDELEHMLQNKDMEIECHNQKHEINTHKIKELQKQVQDLTDLENEYVSNQEEYRQEIEDLKNSLNSQQHNESILSKDLENAREEINKLRLEITKNTQETIQEETSVIVDSNQGENTKEDTIEPTSMTWCHSPTSILYGLETDRLQSTPYKTGTSEKQHLEKDNSNTTLHSTAQHSSQSIVYENSCEIAGMENSRNEFQEEVTNAQKTNQENMEMLLREREQS